MGRLPKFDDRVVLDRATDLFWKHGSDTVSIRDLETALELKAPSIYRRFHSKEQLLVMCLDRYVDEQIGGRIEHFLDGSADPVAGLRAFFTSVLRPHAGDDRLRGCLVANTAGSSNMSVPDVRSVVDRGIATIEAGFRRSITRAVQGGHLDAGLDPESTAKTLLLSFQGLLVLARSGGDDLPACIDATFRTVASPA